MGTEPAVDVDAFTVDAQPGDLYLICSDGLTDMLSEDEIEEVIEQADADPTRTAQALVKGANARGGEDNITVVLFEMVDAEAIVEETPAAPVVSADGAPAPAPQDDGSLTRHGAGPGGRVTAILFLVAIVVLALVLLYWGITR